MYEIKIVVHVCIKETALIIICVLVMLSLLRQICMPTKGYTYFSIKTIYNLLNFLSVFIWHSYLISALFIRISHFFPDTC